MGTSRPAWLGMLGAILLMFGPLTAGARAQSGFFGGSPGRPGGYRTSGFNTSYAPTTRFGGTATAANYFGHRLYGPAGGYGSRSLGGPALGGLARSTRGNPVTGGPSPTVGGFATGGTYSSLSSYGGYRAGERSFMGYSTGGLTSGLSSYRGSAPGARAFGGYSTGGNSLVGRSFGGYATGGSLLNRGVNYGGTASYAGSMMQGGGGRMPSVPAGGYPRSMTSLGGLPH